MSTLTITMYLTGDSALKRTNGELQELRCFFIVRTWNAMCLQTRTGGAWPEEKLWWLQGLEAVGLGELLDLSIRELPVSYEKTQQIIAEIWKTLKPKFAVHLGVARGSSVVMLEQTGRNRGYGDKDVCGFCPESRCCMDGGPETLRSVVNMRAVSKQFREAGIDVLCSGDAGRYLCDFAYYCSLCHGQGRAALVHLPTCGSLASAHTLVPLLQALIRTMLGQLADAPATA